MNTHSDSISQLQDKPFRFYDNRQKYLLFVNTCSEKWVIAERVGKELAHIRPTPPAVRIFDAGVGDGTVLTRVMRNMHRRFTTMPFYVVGKEVSLEDVRLTLEKMPDRFYEHPSTILVLTNMRYSEAPRLAPRSTVDAAAMQWKEVELGGSSAHEFDEQITDLQSWLAQAWNMQINPDTGNLQYERPAVLVMYRADHRFLLDRVIPRIGQAASEYDLVIASQPYRARMETKLKVANILAPLVRSIAPDGRLIGIHGSGSDPGLEIVQRVWPNENPFTVGRKALLKALKSELRTEARAYRFNHLSDRRSIFRYDMHTLPSEITSSVGTSTLFAAWNAAVYVAQIDDLRLEEAIRHTAYLDATRDVLQKHGGLWFYNESYVIARRGLESAGGV